MDLDFTTSLAPGTSSKIWRDYASCIDFLRVARERMVGAATRFDEDEMGEREEEIEEITALMAIAYGDIEDAVQDYIMHASWSALNRLDKLEVNDEDPIIHQFIVRRMLSRSKHSLGRSADCQEEPGF